MTMSFILDIIVSSITELFPGAATNEPAEQAKLLMRLPAHIEEMVELSVNTGARDENVSGLQWARGSQRSRDQAQCVRGAFTALANIYMARNKLMAQVHEGRNRAKRPAKWRPMATQSAGKRRSATKSTCHSPRPTLCRPVFSVALSIPGANWLPANKECCGGNGSSTICHECDPWLVGHLALGTQLPQLDASLVDQSHSVKATKRQLTA